MILFWTPGGMELLLHVEGALAKAFINRGHQVHAVLCDGAYRACILREISCSSSVESWGATGSSTTGRSCIECREGTSARLRKIGIPYTFIGEYVDAQAREMLWRNTEGITWDMLDGLRYRNIDIGKNIKSAIIRYLQGCDVAGNEAVVREYAYSACLSAEAAHHAIMRHAPSQVIMSHGVYAEWGPALQIAFHAGIPITAWMGSYRRACYYFRNIEDTVRLDFHTMSEKAWNVCKQSDLSLQQETRLDSYIENRYRTHTSFDMKRFKEYTGESIQIRQRYAPLGDKPVWGIMAHINWDTVSDYSPMAYSSFDEWIIDSIREILHITDVQWLIKVHPAESWDNPASGVQKLIDRHFPQLPAHIRVISAEEEISPLDFFQMIDGGITVYGTSGLELLLHGKPVILAGEAHYGGKGFTYDGLTPETYRRLLNCASKLPPLDSDQLLLAKKYAYCYFLQRQIPIQVIFDPGSSWWNYQDDKEDLLLPGHDPFMDLICDCTLNGRDFILPENLVPDAEKVFAMEQTTENSADVNDSENNEVIISLVEQASQAIRLNNFILARDLVTQLLSEYGHSNFIDRNEFSTVLSVLNKKIESLPIC
jgi:hypothetical protein